MLAVARRRPDMMGDGLLLSVLWSGWIVAGTLREERDLVADFGDEYRRYQRQVPVLVPWRGPARQRDKPREPKPQHPAHSQDEGGFP